MSYIDLATEIISNFCLPELQKKDLKDLLKTSYKNFLNEEVIEIKKVGDINLVELYHGPTLAFNILRCKCLEIYMMN